MTSKPKYAICVFPKYGIVKFMQKKRNVTIVTCALKFLKPGLHGLHVHMYGDLSEGCASTCNHYNPTKKSHGGKLGNERHRGDLGNVSVDPKGKCDNVFECTLNVHEIIGRALVVHEDEDDLGLGGDEESLKTGNAGKRLDCGVIGIAKKFV